MRRLRYTRSRSHRPRLHARHDEVHLWTLEFVLGTAIVAAPVPDAKFHARFDPYFSDVHVIQADGLTPDHRVGTTRLAYVVKTHSRAEGWPSG
jgi:hypothetical protein